MTHRLANGRHSRCFCCHLIEVQVHRRVISICFESWYDRSSTAYVRNLFGKETVLATLSTCVRIWDTAHWFVAIQYLLLAYAQTYGAPESSGHLLSWLSLHNCQSHSAFNTVYTMIVFLCQIMRHGRTDFWQSCSLCRNTILVRAHLRSPSHSLGDWYMARVFMAKLHLSQLGMSWPKIEVQAQLRSAIQSWMTFLNFYEVNFGMRWLIKNVAFQVWHASTVTICLPSACTPLHSAIFIVVSFIFTMFCSALYQWTLCTQIAISQDTAHCSAGGSSCSPSANISIDGE